MQEETLTFLRKKCSSFGSDADRSFSYTSKCRFSNKRFTEEEEVDINLIFPTNPEAEAEDDDEDEDAKRPIDRRC